MPHYLRALYLDEGTGLVFGSAGGHLHLGYGAYRSQSFSAETHGAKREEILRLAYLTGGMAFEGQTGVHLAHADTVIDHLQQRATRIANDDLNAFGFGIQAVLHQLFQARGGALNDLSCGDLVGYAVR